MILDVQMLVSKCLPYLLSIRIFTDFLNFGTLQKTLYIWVDYTPMIFCQCFQRILCIELGNY